MLIRDLEGKSGLDRATIRFYEREGLIVPQRKENGYREYSEDNLNHLLKIKLLRQLGMSLDTIKGIQQGSGDFSQALSDQIRVLERQIEAAAKAKEVCRQLYEAKPTYETLDAAHYLRLLSRTETKQSTASFREYVPRPYHPVRRFLARMTDYILVETLLEFLIIVILRIRPYGVFLSGLISYGVPFLLLPIHGWMISRWGVTPGKWLFDLTVQSEDGCKLCFSDALEREWLVLKDGFGFGIPVWSLYRLFKSYTAYQEGEPYWGWNVEYHYGDWKKNQKAVLAAVAVFAGILTFVNAKETIKPKHRGELTVWEYADNYNFYYGLINEHVSPGSRMRPDGTWYPDHGNHVVIYLDGEPVKPQQNFEFETENTVIRTIRYENAWTEVKMLQLINIKCQVAALTAVMSQKGMGASDLRRFSSRMETADFLKDGSLNYENIEMYWDIETENCEALGDLYLSNIDDTKDSRASIELVIRIHP